MFVFKFTVFLEFFEPALSLPFLELLNLLLLKISLMLFLQADVFQLFVPNFFFLLLQLQEQLDFLLLFWRENSPVGILVSPTI